MNRVWLAGVLFVSGCAGVKVYDVPKVQQDLSVAMRRTDEVAQKAQGDFADKKALVDNVARTGSSAFREVEASLRADLGEMQDHIVALKEQRRRMADANSDIASLSYNRAKLNSEDRGYDKFESSVKTFEDAAKMSNLEFAGYSQASNALTSTIESKKLYMTFESAEFYKRVQGLIRTSQDNNEEMQTEIDNSQKLLEHGAANSGALKRLEADRDSMQSAAQEYTAKGQHLAEISKEMRAVTGDQRVTSLDPQWPDVQKQLNDLEQTSRDMHTLNAKFLKAAEDFRANAKRHH